MKLKNDEIIKKGCDLLYTEATKCNADFEFCDDEYDGVTYDDEERLTFTTSLKLTPFHTDDGELIPEPVTFEIQYDREGNDYWLVIGEFEEVGISYGNVMATMYFDIVCQSAR